MRTELLVRAVIVCVAAASTNAACNHGGGEIRKDGAASGSPQGGGPGGGQAGSRLVPLSFSGNDGSKAPVGWFDKGLGKECFFDWLGGTTVCVPRDVYTVDAELLSDSYKTANPGLFTDPTCDEQKAIALDETCAEYGVIRITRAPPSYPGCRTPSYGTGLAVVTPVPAGTKIYTYGVPAGGGQCCSCNEWTPPAGSSFRAYFLETTPSEADLAALKLVSGTIDFPTAP